MNIFGQNNFTGGINTDLDAAKIPRSDYPLLINGRTRRNIVESTQKHVKQTLPDGKVQAIYATGSIVVTFIDGVAYYSDITTIPTQFHQVAGFSPLDAKVDRIYSEIIPITSNFLTRIGGSNAVTTSFNASIAAFRQALLCFDGINQPRALFPDGSSKITKTFSDWTIDNPEYIPIGVIPCAFRNKLFLASIDKKKIYHSVSGRMTDFVVNIDNAGNKGGDADTTYASVSYNEITAIKPLSSSQLLIATLYACYTLDLDYNNTLFGEPYLIPNPLFPVGILNDLSVIDILEDTAFITQTGINSFNAVEQAKRESNNFTLGAPLQGLMLSPQDKTCTGVYKDFALFAINTIYGPGVAVYDTIRKCFQSIDLSFGHVKQFANTRVNGVERLFFITHDNEVYEAFAADKANSTRIYIGEFTPSRQSYTGEFIADPLAANKDVKVSIVNLVFANVKQAGKCKISIYRDKEFVESAVLDVSASVFVENFPIPVPFVSRESVSPVVFALSNAIKAWKIGILVEWDFIGALTDLSVGGAVESADNISLKQSSKTDNEVFAFIGNTGGISELNPGGNFLPGDLIIVPVTKGKHYIYDSNGNGNLVTGKTTLKKGIFLANQDHVSIHGNGAATFSLREIENTFTVLDKIGCDKILIGGGDFSHFIGQNIDVDMGLLPNPLVVTTPGDFDVMVNSGAYFYNQTQTPLFFSKVFNFVEFFFYNTNIPHDKASEQGLWLKTMLAASNSIFKIVICHNGAYTNDIDYTSGDGDIRNLPLREWGASACLSSHGRNTERFVVNTFPYINCGAGGYNLAGLVTGVNRVPSSFSNNTDYGYLRLTSDSLSCLIEFVNTKGDVLDTYSLYA